MTHRSQWKATSGSIRDGVRRRDSGAGPDGAEQARIFSNTSRRSVSRSITLKLDLSMNSTAPAASASTVASAPWRVCADNMMHLESRLPAQQPAEHLDAVNPGHRDVESHEIRVGLGDALECLEPVGRLTHDLIPGLRAQNPRERAAHEGGIIHDENANHEAGIPLR